MARRGRPPKIVENPSIEREKEQAAKALGASSASTLFYQIRRRKPGSGFFPFWRRKIPVDSVADINALCYKEGGEDYEYHIEMRDGDGVKVEGFPDSDLPALTESPSGPSAPGPLGDPMGDIMRQRQRDMELQKQELLYQQMEIEMERKQKRLEKLRGGEDDDEDDDGPSYPYPYNPYGAPGYAPSYHPYGMPPWANPMYQQQQRQPDIAGAMAQMAQAMATAMAPRQNDSSLEMIKVFVPLIPSLLGNRKELEPKDMINIFSPILAEANKASGEANKMLLQSMSQMDATFREKLLEVVMSDPNRSEDEVEKFKKYIGLGTDILQKGVKIVTGRDSILKRGNVDVPRLNKDGKPAPPGIGGLTENPEGEKGKEADPVENAKKVIGQRVKAFLLAMEQEALVGSEPTLVAEQLDQLYLFLPEAVRQKVESQEVADIFETFREAVPDVIERIMKATADDASGKMREWYETFWDAVKHPDDGEEDEGGEDEEEPEPQPAPVGDGKGVE